jgi:O-antigen biosynthesis protein
MSKFGLPARHTLALPGDAAATWAMFDPDWYLAAHPDIANDIDDRSPGTVLCFYLDHGQSLRHSPNIWFDERWHLAAYPGVAARVERGHFESAFDAYCREGFHGRAPHWLFDELAYRLTQSDVTEAVLAAQGMANGYDHYLRQGDRERRTGSRFFDPGIYCAALAPHAARDAAELGPFVHFLKRVGAGKADVPTTIYFDPAWYRVTYPSVFSAPHGSLCALQHYLTNDAPAQFCPLPLFSESFYLERNPDVAATVVADRYRNGYDHFLRLGARDWLAPSPGTDLAHYANGQPCAAWLRENPAGDPFTHFLAIGRDLGLSIGPLPKAAATIEEANALIRRKAISLAAVSGRAQINFTCTGMPEVSAVLVMRGKFALTLLTLASLRANYAGGIELILVDAGSRDESRVIDRYAKGVRVIQFDKDMSVGDALNAGMLHASADAVLLLDSGVELAHDAVCSALRRLASDPAAGVVGGKMIRANGDLREAGHILWRDGSSAAYFRGASPLAAEANFVRPVHFCSLDFLMARRSLVQRVGYLDTAFTHRRLIEADLGIRITVNGFVTAYDPGVGVHVHDDPDSDDTELACAGEHDAFVRKHAGTLRFRYISSERVQVFARLALPPVKRVLFIEDTIPVRMIGSGFVRSNDIIHAMASLGYQVTVFPVLGYTHDVARAYADMPDTVETMHHLRFEDFAAFLAERQGYFDAVWVARAHNMNGVRPFLERLVVGTGRPPVMILDTEAIDACRQALLARLRGTPAADLAMSVKQELANADFCQSVVVTSKQEGRLLQNLGFPDVAVIGHTRTLAPTPRAFSDRSGMLFVGAIHQMDSPNHDSLIWFLKYVLPLVEQSLGWETRLTIAGYTGPSVDLEPLARNSRVALRGAVSNLEPLYDSHRLFVAPTRFAAGMPYKIHEAASFGLPIVASSLLREQTGWTDGTEMLSADTTNPTAFAAQIVRLHRDEALWTHLREMALSRLERENGAEAYAASIRAVLEPQPAGHG